MLVYLDTAQFAWLEQADPRDRERFLETWRELGCELAVSLQILQEVRKRGTAEDVSRRLTTLATLGPLRGIPAGSAGVTIREATVQIRRMLGQGSDDPLAEGQAEIFPEMSLETLVDAMNTHSGELHQFNLVGDAQATIQAIGLALPPLEKGVRVDPLAMELGIREQQRQTLKNLPEGVTADMVRSMGERVISAIKAADGDLWKANLIRLGIDGMAYLGEIQPEDYLKTSTFREAAREWADDIAAEAGITTSEVLAHLDELHPYQAPGFSLEMAVFRARGRHSSEPTAADQVDEEHVSFAPYVDLLFADKRTVGYLKEETQRKDGRVAYDASEFVAKARNLEDVRTRLVAAAP